MRTQPSRLRPLTGSNIVVAAAAFAAATALIVGFGVAPHPNHDVPPTATVVTPRAYQPMPINRTAPAPRTTVSPVNPATWSFAGGSLGPVTIGQPAAKILPAAGFTKITTEGCATEWEWQSTPGAPAFTEQVITNPDGDAVNAQLYADAPAGGSLLFPGSPRTSMGITLGSTVTALLDAYPHLSTYPGGPNGGYYFAKQADGSYLVFATSATKNGRIVSQVWISDTTPGQSLC